MKKLHAFVKGIVFSSILALSFIALGAPAAADDPVGVTWESVPTSDTLGVTWEE